MSTQSSASSDSHFHFEVDRAYNKQHNEMYRDSRRLQVSAIVFAVLLVLIGVLLTKISIAFTVLFALGAVYALVVALLVPRSIGSAQENYDRYPLVACEVAKVNPRDCVIMALVNVSIDPHVEPVWALAVRTVTRLDAPATVGMRVPAVAMAGKQSKNKDTYDQVSPMPITWATPDKSVVRQAEQAIDEAQWQRLAALRDQVDAVLATPTNLLVLDKHQG